MDIAFEETGPGEKKHICHCLSGKKESLEADVNLISFEEEKDAWERSLDKWAEDKRGQRVREWHANFEDEELVTEETGDWLERGNETSDEDTGETAYLWKEEREGLGRQKGDFNS